MSANAIDATAMDVEVLRYSRVWEDQAILVEALALDAGSDVLTIASAGDNALALLAAGPRSVTAVDMSPAQCALVHLQIAAIDALDLADFRILLGHDPDDGTRSQLWAKVRPSLPGEAQLWFDRHEDDLEAGIAGRGRLERYIAQFFGPHTADLVTRDDWLELIETPEPDARRQLFDRIAAEELRNRWAGYFDRETMGRSGRDPEQLRYVEIDVASWLFERLRRACCELPTIDNPYLRRMVLGEEGPSPVAHLRGDVYARLRGLLDRLQVVQASVGDLLSSTTDGRWSHANLSNIFEYLSAEQSHALFDLLARRLRPDGRLAWWSLMVPREPSTPLLAIDPRSSAWSEVDRSFLYRTFHVATTRTESSSETSPESVERQP